MTDADIGFLPAADLLAHYHARTLSPVEVVDAVLRHVEATEPALNAIVLLTAETARGSARAAEAAYARGTARKLEGVPVTIKDLQQTKGVPTQMGSRMFEGHVPDVDTPCVTRLHDAGCIMLGKTTAPEFGWKGVSQSPLTGITHNPWQHGMSAGGSSSGAAAGAAAGYGPLHQGGDGAGSIRIPAHMCGVFGIKATHGRVPCWPMSNNDLATHLGPITRTVTDAALMLEAMAGPHPWDYTSLEAPPQDYAVAAARRPARQAHRLQPRPRPCPGGRGRSGAGAAGGGRVRGARRHGRAGDARLGPEGEGAVRLLLADRVLRPSCATCRNGRTSSTPASSP